MELVLGNGNDYNIRVVVVTGACRSGKTTLSRLLSSMKNIEWIEEPWALMQLPILEHFNVIDKEITISFIRAYAKELFNDNVLLRNANFRHSDLSSIWNIKRSMDIFNRINNIKTREDVQIYIDRNSSILLIDIPEIQPFIDILYQSFRNVKIIHVVRNGLNVAHQVQLKEWFSEENLLNPKHNSLLYKYKQYYIPWWVKEDDADNFVDYSEISKGLYYWFRMISYNDFYKREKLRSNYKIIKYEDLVLNPIIIIDELTEFLETKKTDITNELINEIHQNDLSVLTDSSFKDIQYDLLMEIKDAMQNYGYKL